MREAGDCIQDGTYKRATSLLERASDGRGVIIVNDADGHEAVLAMYDRAIAAAPEEVML
jgi:hypothetical protein